MKALQVTLVLLFLNAALSFNNWWPTAAIRPDWRLAPEFVALWVVLLLAARRYGSAGRRLIGGLALIYLLLVLGRYLDVTVPVLYGRPLNLYWDAYQLPRFLSVSAQYLAPWQQMALLLGLATLFWGLYRLLRWAIGISAREAAPRALRSRAALAATAVAVGLVAANLAGVRATWPVVARPVSPTYIQQASLLITAFLPGRLATALPPSPPFDSDLAALRGLDVKLFFLESYGATVFDRPETRARLASSRAALEARIAATGRQVVSAFVGSPTFGGASDLAHLSLLSGIDLRDPVRHDLLLTTDRPTLIRLFRERGYETFGFYPALSWEWPERRFYGFDRFLDGPGLGYEGPHFGYWWLPDQYSIARFQALNPVRSDSPPRFIFFATITSHIPYRPVPPYQPDWQRLLSARPFDEDETARALADGIDWTDLYPGFVRSIEYTYRWLAGYLDQPYPREYLLVLIGDHQPSGGVVEPNAPWEVPVHVISSRPELLARLMARGFTPGFEPERPARGMMHELTAVLQDVFDGRCRQSAGEDRAPC